MTNKKLKEKSTLKYSTRTGVFSYFEQLKCFMFKCFMLSSTNTIYSKL